MAPHRVPIINPLRAPTYEELMRQQMAAAAGEGFEEVELGRNEDDMHEEVTLVSADAGFAGATAIGMLEPSSLNEVAPEEAAPGEALTVTIRGGPFPE